MGCQEVHEAISAAWARLRLEPMVMTISPSYARLVLRQLKVRKRRPHGSMRQRKRLAGRVILN